MDSDKPNAQRIVSVTADMLPIRCPQLGTTLWNSHPRVYIPVTDTGHARCPYCGTEFMLAEEEAEQGGSSMIDADAEVDAEAVDIFG